MSLHALLGKHTGRALSVVAIFAGFAASAADWQKQATEDAKQDRTTVAYDAKTPNKLVCDTTLRQLPDSSWPYRRVLVPESCDGPKGRMNYPDGFVSKDRQWLHFAFDDNRHRAVYYGAKLPPVAGQ